MSNVYQAPRVDKKLSLRTKPARRPRVIVPANQWERRMATVQRREKRGERALETYEISVEDLRDEALGAIRTALGRGHDAFEIVHARFGPHPSTLSSWEAHRVRSPRMSTLRAALRAVGLDLTIGPIKGDATAEGAKG